MGDLKTSFISYTSNQDEFVRYYLVSLLKEVGYSYNFSLSGISLDENVFEFIAKNIKNSDLFVCVYDRKSPYISFEIGVALGNNKPVLTILPSTTYLDFPTELNFTTHIIYDKSNYSQFRRNFIAKVKALSEEIIDKAVYAFATKAENKVIAIQAGIGESSYENELKFTYEFIQLIKEVTDNPQIKLFEVSKGSLKSILNIDLKSYAELMEKIIFFIPELKKKKLENLKVEAELERIKTETRILESENSMKQAHSFIDLLAKYKESGINIQLDNELVIAQNREGMITIKNPVLLLGH